VKRAATLRFAVTVGLFALLIASLYVVSDVSHDAERFGRLYVGLLLLNTLFLLVLGFAIVKNLYLVGRQVVRKAPGSRLTLRMVLVFVLLVTVPAGIVYEFSVHMLKKGIDTWFDIPVQEALEDSLELSRAALDLQMREFRRRTLALSESLADVSDAVAPLALNDMLKATGATEITLFGADNKIIASSSNSTDAMIPRLPGAQVLNTVAEGRVYSRLEPFQDIGLQMRIVVPVRDRATRGRPRILQVLYPVSGRLTELAEKVEAAYRDYTELAYLREPLKQNIILTLSLVLLVAALFAVWAAIYMSRKLIAPIRELAEGTKAVAAGEYRKKLPVGRRDELGELVLSFNQMTERLARARDAAERSQRLVERQRSYLETLLQRLSSGVMSFDGQLALRTVNAAAAHILGVSLVQYKGRRLEEIAREHPALESLVRGIAGYLKSGKKEWREQVVIMGPTGRKILMCRGARLPAYGDVSPGYVVVFDDVTALIQAQREAAWAEVARRLAHEIKNPLTPIQLSAERIQRKLSASVDEKGAEILERSTRTIVQQVESMKAMVNAFGDYARTPSVELSLMNINDLVRDVAELYRANIGEVRLELDLDETLAGVQADAMRLRQLLHNLIKNAMEAMEGRSDARIVVQTRNVDEHGARYVDLTVSDTGPGIPEALMDRLFEPYVTSKSKGTGLGLAIVRKIVEEHGGQVWAENLPRGGARIHIRFPATTTQTQSPHDIQPR